MHNLIQKILGTCERVANIFLHPGTNYTYMYNLHTVCKSAHVNGALESHWNYFSTFIFEIEMLIFGNLLYDFKYCSLNFKII